MMKQKKTETKNVLTTVVSDGSHHVIHRAGRVLKTPAGKAYRLPTAKLAEAIAAEWRAQGDKIVPATMPLAQLAATAIDIVPQKRSEIIEQVVGYAASELLCHRAATPAALAHQQQEVWQPLLDWCALRFDALLCPGTGIMPINQTAEAVRALHKAIAGYDDFFLAGLSSAVDAAGSLVLGLALIEQNRSADEVFRAAELDAHFQTIAWGTDPVITARHEAIRRDLEACENWFALLRA
jgi:chaperone required for assembly of F1-ATPase